MDWPFNVYNNITDITEIPQKKATIVNQAINRNSIVLWEAIVVMATAFLAQAAHALSFSPLPYLEKSRVEWLSNFFLLKINERTAILEAPDHLCCLLAGFENRYWANLHLGRLCGHTDSYI